MLDDPDVQVVPEAMAQPMDVEEEEAVLLNDPVLYPDLDFGFDFGSDDDDDVCVEEG